MNDIMKVLEVILAFIGILFYSWVWCNAIVNCRVGDRKYVVLLSRVFILLHVISVLVVLVMIRRQ